MCGEKKSNFTPSPSQIFFIHQKPHWDGFKLRNLYKINGNMQLAIKLLRKQKSEKEAIEKKNVFFLTI